MQKTNFDRLLHRYFHNELTPEENEKFSAWLDLLEKENAGDLEMSAEAKEHLFQRISSNISSVDDVVALDPRKPAIKKLFEQRWAQVAATVLVMLSVTFAAWQFIFNQGTDSLAYTEKLILNDGTIVWISESHNFSYYEKGGARFATFTGEALFEVAKLPESPFTISCGPINVRVLGTSFTLKADSGQIELNVLTGKVNVTSETDKVGVDVKPNERIVYSNGGIVERSFIAPAALKSVADNREYNMEFQGASMEEVVDSIAKKFNVTVIVRNQNLKKCHVSADFTDHSLEGTLSILSDLLDMNYRVNGNQIELSGAGC